MGASHAAGGPGVVYGGVLLVNVSFSVSGQDYPAINPGQI